MLVHLYFQSVDLLFKHNFSGDISIFQDTLGHTVADRLFIYHVHCRIRLVTISSTSTISTDTLTTEFETMVVHIPCALIIMGHRGHNL